MKIPTNIQLHLNQLNLSEEPQAVVRALRDLNGNLGETYFFANSFAFYCYSGTLDQPHQFYEFPLVQISSLEINEDPPFAYLTMTFHEASYSFKFAHFDLSRVSHLRAIWLKQHPEYIDRASPGISVTSPAADPSRTVTPIIQFCAALQALIHVDNHESSEELHTLTLMLGDPAVVRAGYELWQQQGTATLLDGLGQTFTEPQKLCLMANLLNIAMIDGVLNAAEKQFIEAARDVFDISLEQTNSLIDALIIKNNLTVF